PEPADAVVPLPEAWLAQLAPGDRIHFTDARGAFRSMNIAAVHGHSRWAEARRTAYVFDGMVLQIRGLVASNDKHEKSQSARVGPIPATEQTLHLKVGDRLLLTKSLQPGRASQSHTKYKDNSPARIGVSLAEFFDSVRPGQPIWLDDGKIGGVIRE